jgi:hypothetical protein
MDDLWIPVGKFRSMVAAEYRALSIYLENREAEKWGFEPDSGG